MDTLKPLFEEVAKDTGRLVLSLYFEPRNYANQQEMQTEQQRLQEQMGKYQHGGVIQRRINPEETQLVLNSPEHVDAVLKDVMKEYRGIVYDVFLANDSGQPHGMPWALYDFMGKIDAMECLISFYTEIAKSPVVPETLQPKLASAVREVGTTELKKRGLEDKVAEWESIIV
ncbi:MAG: hypothetical protein U9Q06_00015 [Nanoarchaeota archaeon]|nr:hypothetical protein [Nanoarchaeota archaeon]